MEIGEICGVACLQRVLALSPCPLFLLVLSPCPLSLLALSPCPLSLLVLSLSSLPHCREEERRNLAR